MLLQRIRACRPFLVASLVAWGSVCAGQEAGGDREQNRRGGWGGPEQFFERMDSNGNGLLEPDEVNGRARVFVERAARDAGLDPEKPIPLEKLREAMREQFGRNRGWGRRGGEEESRDRGQQGGREDRPFGRGRGGPDGSRRSDAKPEPQVPGFGVEVQLAAVPGFGPVETGSASQPAAAGGEAAVTTGGDAGVSTTSSASASNDGREKIARYAASMLKQYDRNGDGVLEKEEWSAMKAEHHAADRDGDGLITQDELADRLLSYSNSDPGKENPRRYIASSTGPRRSYRASKPSERLPKGLPTWFSTKDRDADGQVLMSEFASAWTEAIVAEFSRHDGNGDGIITASECQAAIGDKPRTAATQTAAP